MLFFYKIIEFINIQLKERLDVQGHSFVKSELEPCIEPLNYTDNEVTNFSLN